MAMNVAASREAMAAYYGTQGVTLSLHTADPGTTGASEVTGGSPAYARKAAAWSGGAVDGTITAGQVTFDAPAGTYAWVGVWKADGTTFWDKISVASTTLGAQGQVLVTVTVNVV